MKIIKKRFKPRNFRKYAHAEHNGFVYLLVKTSDLTDLYVNKKRSQINKVIQTK